MSAVDLRQERERRGLSLDEVSQRSRIPRNYLLALESGEVGGLPRGPFLESYQRQYLLFLGLPVDSRPGHSPRPVAVSPGAASPGTASPSPVAPTPIRVAPGAATRGPSLPGPALPPRPAPSTSLETEVPPMGAPAAGAPGNEEPSFDPDELGRTRTITRHYDNVPIVRLILAGFLATMALVLSLKLLSGLVDRLGGGGPEPHAVVALAPPAGRTDKASPPAPAPAEAAPPVETAPAAEEAPAAENALDGDAEVADAALQEAEAAAALARSALSAPDAPSTGPVPERRVNLRANERVRLKVILDGAPAFDGWLEPGEAHDFLGEERVAIEVDDLTNLTIAYDGQRVDPLGNLAHPRRLVFLRDDT